MTRHPGAATLSAHPSGDPRLSVRIAREVRQRIENGTLAPGDLVVIGALTREYGVSRDPCQAAVQQLADEGLLRRYPGVGYVVLRVPASKESGHVQP